MKVHKKWNIHTILKTFCQKLYKIRAYKLELGRAKFCYFWNIVYISSVIEEALSRYLIVMSVEVICYCFATTFRLQF